MADGTMLETAFCALCGLRVHTAWPQGEQLNIVRARETNENGMVWRHYVEPPSDGHDPVIVPKREVEG